MKSLIKIILLIEGFWFFIATIIDALSEKSSPPNWFDYIALSLICFGLWAIIKAIEEKNINKNI